nr:hypothetical protein Q903MT_gene5066 [Picea sitchensis]
MIDAAPRAVMLYGLESPTVSFPSQGKVVTLVLEEYELGHSLAFSSLRFFDLHTDPIFKLPFLRHEIQFRWKWQGRYQND